MPEANPLRWRRGGGEADGVVEKPYLGVLYMLNKKFISVILLLFISGFLFAQSKPVITVFPLENKEKDLQIEVISKNVQKTVELNLKMMDKYVVANNSVTSYTGTNEWLLDYSTKNKIDNIIFGKAQMNKAGNVVLQMSVFNRESKSVTLTKTENAETLFDIFKASDLLAVGMIEGFSGLKLGFGELKFTNKGEKGNYSVYIDNVLAGESVSNLTTIMAGSKTVRITQERMFGSYELYNNKAVIENKKVTEIVFNIPGFLEKEEKALGKEEANITKNWNDKSSTKSVDKSFTKLFELQKLTGYSESESKKKKEIEEKYIAWGKQKEQMGPADRVWFDQTILDKTFGVSLFIGGAWANTTFDLVNLGTPGMKWVDDKGGGSLGKLGITFSVNLPYNFALQTEFAYAWLTVDYDFQHQYMGDSYRSRSIELELFEIPLLVMYRLPGKYITIYTGPLLQIRTPSSPKYEYHFEGDNRVQDKAAPTKSFACPITAGIKAEIPIYKSTFLEFDIRYAKGFNYWINEQFDSDYSNGGGGVFIDRSLKTDLLYLTIGYGVKF